jgi:hypothetical protein
LIAFLIKMKPDLKKIIIPSAVAVVLFFILALIYFKPLFGGKELSQHDITQHQGMSKEIVDHRNSEHEEPLWTNSMFGGMPAYLVSTIYEGNWMATIDKAFKLYLPPPSGYFFFYFIGFFILLLCLDVEPWAAVISSVAYGLSSMFIIILVAGHNSKANAIGYIAPLLGGIILTLKGRYWLGTALVVLFMALEINAGHPQISYYSFFIFGFVGLSYFFAALREKKLPSFFKSVALILVAALIGLLPNAASLMCTNEYGKYSIRGKTELTINESGKSNAGNITSGVDRAYATRWSHGISESFTFLIPDYKGGSSYIPIKETDPKALKKVSADYRDQVGSMGAYFGEQPSTFGPVYIGAIVIFLAALGMFIVKHRIKWALFGVTLLGMGLAFGHNMMWLTNLFMDYIPMYNKFRSVSFAMIIPQFTLPLLAALAINELVKKVSLSEKIKLRLINTEMELKKIIIACFILTAGICLISFLMPDAVNTFHGENEEQMLISRYSGQGPEAQIKQFVTELMPEMETARKALFVSDALRSFVFILLAFVFIWLYFSKKIKKELLFGALGIFILIDLWTVDTRYLNSGSFLSKSQKAAVFAKTYADEEILKDPSIDYRVLNLSEGIDGAFNESQTSYWHKSIGGYHGAKLKKYQELINFHIDHNLRKFGDNFYKNIESDSAINQLMASLNVINMLNTKWFIMPGKEGSKLPFENKAANGNVWFVKNVKVVENADKEIMGLYDVDTKTEAITQEKFRSKVKIEPNYSADGSIKLLSYKPNHLVYESDTKQPQFAVFSEIYYPKGWNAYVDGALDEHICVNYVLRGMPISSGKHRIEFKFEPEVYKIGNTISLVGSILVILTVLLCLYLEKKNTVN